MSRTEEELTTEVTEADVTAARTETDTARPATKDRAITDAEVTEVRAAVTDPPEPPARSKQSLEREAVANEVAAEKAQTDQRWGDARQHWQNAKVCWEAARTAAPEPTEPTGGTR
jgi:hypothetical protein